MLYCDLGYIPILDNADGTVTIAPDVTFYYNDIQLNTSMWTDSDRTFTLQETEQRISFDFANMQWVSNIQAPPTSLQIGSIKTTAGGLRMVRWYSLPPKTIRVNTIYVDASNGDDFNLGTKDAPKKTLRAAIAAFEKNPSAQIIWLAPGDYYVEESPYLLKTVNLGNRQLVIFGDDNQARLIVRGWNEDGLQLIGGLRLGAESNGCVVFRRCNILTQLVSEFAGPVAATSLTTIWEGLIYRVDHKHTSVIFFLCNIEIGDISIVRAPTGPGFVRVAQYDEGTTITIRSGGTGTFIKHEGYKSIDLSVFDTAKPYSSYVTNIVRDADGLPRNIVSNYVF